MRSIEREPEVNYLNEANFLALRAEKFGGACRDRTCDHLIKSQMLYQLS